MEVELLFWEGCPSHPAAFAELRAALGEGVEVRVREIVTEEQAVAERLPGLADDPRRRGRPVPLGRAALADLPDLSPTGRPLLPHPGPGCCARRSSPGSIPVRGRAAATLGGLSGAGVLATLAACVAHRWSPSSRSPRVVRQAPRPTGTATAVTTATATATPTEVVAAAPSGPWSAPVAGHREPPKCPVASSRAGWPSRVLALGDGKYAKLWGQRPRLADVDADGHLLGQTELGARRPAATRRAGLWA